MASADGLKVTVVVPTHNTSELVTRNVESLAAQTMPASDFEVIYVDDGSDDGTADLIERTISGRPAFRLIRSENSGWPGRPRNLGIEAARGDYVFFSDDDDWLAPDALEHLHARAVADDADIVIGRIAGHGRGSHRHVQASLTGGDIRRPEHSVLLRTMTVHKLFRRAFVEEHRLRFPEGQVRLEDHIFMLSAYLRTNRVSIMHDRTVYHWMRTSGSGNHSFGAVDPEGYTSSIARLFRIIDEEIDDPGTRRRFVLNWYQRKVLKHVPQAHFLKGSREYADALVRANRTLVEAWIPADYDERLPHALRIRAALLRRGDTETMRAWGAYERGMTLRTAVSACEWRDDMLVLRLSVEVVDRDGQPITFRRDGDRVVRELPPAYTGLEPACDVTADLRLAEGRVLIRNRLPTGDVVLAATSTQVATALAGGRFSVRFEVETAIDPMTADKGHPISGVWDVFATADLCGHSTMRWVTIGDDSSVSLKRHRLPAGVAKPVVTSHGNLSLRVGAARAAAAERVPLTRKARGGLRKLRVLARRSLRRAERRIARPTPNGPDALNTPDALDAPNAPAARQ
jgi:poly(ribitol-phosphate) beta-N-acetylglucosaminyltransferase